MALLQITEPGQAAADTEGRARRFAAGIDLGTTNSLAAMVISGGDAPRVLRDGAGEAILPSAVYFGADEVCVGAAALAKRGVDAANVLVSTKRLMGRAASEVRGDYRYRYAGGGGMAKIQTARGDVSPVQAAAEILKALRMRAAAAVAAAAADAVLYGAVITVPAYFDDAQRQATKDAAALAGVKVLRLLNEPTAAAVAYGLEQAEEGVYAIYDLGGGTFDVSVLRLRRGVFQVLATGGDTALGGDDFDRALANLALQKTGKNAGDDDWGALAAAAQTAKEKLTFDEKTTLSCRLASGELRAEISRAELEKQTAPLIGRTLKLTKRALADAGFSPAEVAGAVLVGGATRMPRVKSAIAEMFGRAPFADLDPDCVVALGAAAQANALANGGGWLLLDVIPLSLGVETMGGLAEKIIPRNSPIPAAKAQEFTTYRDGQTAMIIHVVQGERELVADCRSLARFTLSGIPPLAAGAARIRVSFTVDADGLLTVAAQEKTTGVRAQVEVKPSYGLRDDEIAKMLEDSRAFAKSDVRARLLAERKTEAAQLVEITRAALSADGDALLSPPERVAIEEKINALAAAADGDDDDESADAIHAAIKALDAAAADFAARRMNAGVKRALAGRTVDEV